MQVHFGVASARLKCVRSIEGWILAMKKIISLICAIILACLCLTGCEFFQEENGQMHFMLFGQKGPTKDGKPLSEGELASISREDALSETDNVDREEHDLQDQEDSFSETDADDKMKNQSDSDPYISAAALKLGWTSDDHSILRGTDVLLTTQRELFSISAKENREVTFQLDAVLENGDYEIVLVSPDETETVLYDTDADSGKKKETLKEGENSVWIRTDQVEFQRIDLSIDGLKASDF